MFTPMRGIGAQPGSLQAYPVGNEAFICEAYPSGSEAVHVAAEHGQAGWRYGGGQPMIYCDDSGAPKASHSFLPTPARAGFPGHTALPSTSLHQQEFAPPRQVQTEVLCARADVPSTSGDASARLPSRGVSDASSQYSMRSRSNSGASAQYTPRLPVHDGCVPSAPSARASEVSSFSAGSGAAGAQHAQQAGGAVSSASARVQGQDHQTRLSDRCAAAAPFTSHDLSRLQPNYVQNSCRDNFSNVPNARSTPSVNDRQFGVQQEFCSAEIFAPRGNHQSSADRAAAAVEYQQGHTTERDRRSTSPAPVDPNLAAVAAAAERQQMFAVARDKEAQLQEMEMQWQQMKTIFCEVEELTRKQKQEHQEEMNTVKAQHRAERKQLEAKALKDRDEIDTIRRDLQLALSKEKDQQKALQKELEDVKRQKENIAVMSENRSEALKKLTEELEAEKKAREDAERMHKAILKPYEEKCEMQDEELQSLREARRSRQTMGINKVVHNGNDTRRDSNTVFSDVLEDLHHVDSLPEALPTVGINPQPDFSASYDNDPIVANQEGMPELAELDISEAQFDVSAPPSAGGMLTSGNLGLGSETRKRLSHAFNAVAQAPETPGGEGEIVRGLFDTSRTDEAASAILATPGVSLLTPLSTTAGTVLPDGFRENGTTLTVGHTTPADSGTVGPALEAAPASSASAPSAAEVCAHPIPSNTTDSQSLVWHALPSDDQEADATEQGAHAKAEAAARVPPMAKAAAKPAAKSKAAQRRSSSERGRQRADRSPRSPMRFSPRNDHARQALSATPPRVEKESPPRGCVAEKVSMFESKCTTPAGQARGANHTPRQAAGASGETSRRAVRAATPSGTGTGASGVRTRTEERAIARAEKAAQRSSAGGPVTRSAQAVSALFSSKTSNQEQVMGNTNDEQ